MLVRRPPTYSALVVLVVLATACGARSTLEVTPPDAPAPDARLVDAGRDAGSDAGLDAGRDAGEDAAIDDDAGMPCAWGSGVVGAWRVPGPGASDAQLPALLHVDVEGRARSTLLDSRSGGAFGMGVAAHDRVVGASWRVRRDDGGNALYFVRVVGGCVLGAPSLVHEAETLQTFRGNLVASSSGWMVFWLAEGGLWMRPLGADGEALAAAARIVPTDDARFSVAARADRVGVLYVESTGSLRLIDLGTDGSPLRSRILAECSSFCLEPRLVALGAGWGGTFLDGSRILAFDTGDEVAPPHVTPLGEACTACISDPTYLLPSTAAMGRRVGALWAIERDGARELVVAIAAPSEGRVESVGPIARGNDLRWPALGHDGTRLVAVYDDSSGVNVRFVDGASIAPGTGASTLVGSQRIPSLAAVP